MCICIYTSVQPMCVDTHTAHTLHKCSGIYTQLCSDPGKDIRPTDPHGIHTHSYTHTHTHTPVAIDLHFLHRHTATPAAHTQIYRSVHDSPLGRRKCMCTAAHRHPVCSCVDGLAHRCRDGLCGHPGAVHTRTYTRARAGENRGSFH